MSKKNGDNLIKAYLKEMKDIKEMEDSLKEMDNDILKLFEESDEKYDCREGNSFMISKTYGVIITNSDIAFSEVKLNEIKDGLNNLLQVGEYFIAINPTPLNTVCSFSPVIYAIDRKTEHCMCVVEKIEEYLLKKGYCFKRFTTELRWDEENKVFLEIKR